MNIAEIKRKASTYVTGIVLVLSVIALGMLKESFGAVALVILSLLFFCLVKKGDKMELSLGLTISSIICIGYFLSIFYSIDFGMAALGLVKYLWILPTLAICQKTKGTDKALDLMVYLGSILSFVGIIGYFIEPIKEIVYEGQRFSGSFSYANTCGIFLLLCVVWLGDKKILSKMQLLQYVLLLVGIGLTGSRIVYVLTIGSVLYLIIKNRNKKMILVTVGLFIVAIILVLTQHSDILSRIKEISLGESTFVGRLLYMQDALPLLFQHPFGMGYMGYYEVQNAIQSGWYSTQYVHNDFLQLALDVGIIPLAIYMAGLVYALISRKVSLTKKVMILILALHGQFDFDLSFGAMFLIMMLLLDEVKLPFQKEIVCKVPVKVVSLVLIGVGIYLSIPLMAYEAGDNALAYRLYPWHTQAQIELLSEESDVDQAEQLADDILSRNEYCALAYFAKGMVADIEGDYEKMVDYGRKAIDLDYFNIAEYQNYTSLLYDGLVSGDSQAYERCRKEVLAMPKLMEENKKKLSTRGKQITDQPELEVDETLQEIIDAVK